MLAEGARHKEQVRSLEQQYNALYQQYEVLNQRHTQHGSGNTKQVRDGIGSLRHHRQWCIFICTSAGYGKTLFNMLKYV